MATKDSFVAVQLYQTADPYHYTVDNRPLQDIITNLNFLADTFDTSIASFTPQSVIFASGAGTFTQDNTNFNYNSTTKVLTATNGVISAAFRGVTLDSNAATALLLKTNAIPQFTITHTASAVNLFSTSGSVAASPLALAATGTDTDITIDITPKGIGLARLNSAVAWPASITPTQITGNTNNYAPTGGGSATTIRFNTDASRNITGFTGGLAGRVVTFINVGTNPAIFTNEDANSTAANRFTIHDGNVTIPANGVATFWYDTTTSRWIWTSGLAAPGADTLQTLTDAATVNWNVNTGGWSILTATAGVGASRTVAAPTNIVDGREYTMWFVQDASGSRTITWNGVFKWPLATAPVLSTGANAIDMFNFKARGGNLYGAFLKGYG
jgi:hypothetical protein